MDQALKPFIAAFSKSQDVFDTVDAHLVMAIQLNKSRENVLQSHKLSLTKNSGAISLKLTASSER